jgi:hypothetical protein
MSIENKLNAKSTLLSFVPTTILGAVAMGYAQQKGYTESTSVPTALASGLLAQTIVRSLTILPAHAYMNRKRLKKSKGGFNKGTYAQEILTIASSAKLLYTPWLAALTALDLYLLSKEYSHLEAGLYSSAITGSGYAILLAAFSPKINDIVNSTKSFIKRKLT